MKSLLRYLWLFWFQPAPAERLGFLRAAIGGYALYYVSTRASLISDLARKSGKLWEPVGPFRILGDPMDPVAVDWMLIATIIAGVFFVFGYLYRLSGPAFAILLCATLCYRNSWSMIYHMHNALVLHMLILGFVRAADGFSIDSWIRHRRGSLAPKRSGCSWEFGWPIKLLCMTTAISYCLAGIAKVLGPSGFMWATGESMRSQVAVDTIRKEVLEGGGMDAAFILYDHVWLFAMMGVVTLVVEIGAPLFVLGKWSSRIWALTVWGMHWGIFFIMGIKFRYQLSFIIFLPFFHVEMVLHFSRQLIARLGAGTPSQTHQTSIAPQTVEQLTIDHEPA